MERKVDSIHRQLQLMVTRGVITMVDSQRMMQQLQLKTIGGVLLDNVEHFEPYGFTSCPYPGAEVISLSAGGRMGHEVAICVADRRYRLVGLESGEVTLYDDLGHSITLKRNGIAVNGAGHNISISNCPQVVVTGGDVIADGISLKTHVHGGVQTGGGNTGVPHA